MSPSLSLRVLWPLVSLAVVTEEVCGIRSSGGLGGLSVGGSVHQVDVMVSQVVENHLAGCHLVLATTENNGTLSSSILRRLLDIGQARVLVEVSKLFSQDQPVRDHLLQKLWGDGRLTCRALVLVVDSHNTHLLLRFVEASRLWLRPDIPTVVISGSSVATSILHHTSLRNTIHLLYLALENVTHMRPIVKTWLRRGTTGKDGGERVRAFQRCLYCDRGEMGVQLLQRSNLSAPNHWEDNILFSDHLDNFMGHTFRVVTLVYFPFITYDKDATHPEGPVSPLDSLDVRMLDAIAAHLNFTYEIREPWDGTWGVPLAGGNWSGIVGTLQHEQADFSLNLTPSPARMEVITHSRIYTHDPLVIVSLKPGPLPRHLALKRPFVDEVWIMVIVCTSSAGVILWLLQKVWSRWAAQRSIRLDTALFYSWGVLLQDSPGSPPANISSQVCVGWWLLFCLVVTTAYRSSLIAHLSVQSKFPPVNTFEDLLSREGWSWGGLVLWGTTFLYFNQSSDPVIQEVYKQMPTYEVEQGMDRVLSGSFSYVTVKSYTKIDIASLYYDEYGNTPIHLGATEYPVLGGNSWGFRQGAPFLSQFRRTKQRLIETGMVDHWMDDVIKIKVRQIRESRSGEGARMASEVEDGQVVLSLDHLQGVLYLLLLGYVVAFLALVGENMTFRHVARLQPSQTTMKESHAGISFSSG
ncbi:glutamate receptor-like [Panulirus ornatus]|uniref:glutamate receptor-like n=1 Tax=Panulirus ornatus TaxID=150431 RepID=UPI003A8BC44B